MNTTVTQSETPDSIYQQLEKIMVDDSDEIVAVVAKEALMYSDPEDFFFYVLSHGCRRGFVRSLMDCMDINNFYEEHYFEIEVLRLDHQEEHGPIWINRDLKMQLAFFAFDRVARRLAKELKIEV